MPLMLAEMLGADPGVEVLNKTFFNEFTIRVPRRCAARRGEARRKRGVLGGVPASRLESGSRPELRNLIIVASTEVNTDEDRAAYVEGALKEVLA